MLLPVTPRTQPGHVAGELELGAGLLTPSSLWHHTVPIVIGFITALAQSRKGQRQNESLNRPLGDLGRNQKDNARRRSVSVQVLGSFAAKPIH